MKTRAEKLVLLRRAESRLASAVFAETTTQLAGQLALGIRLSSAAAELSPRHGLASGADLAACAELAGRMQTAHRMTLAKIADARADRDAAANARLAARRALDAAVEICRAQDRAEIARAEARAMPPVVKGSWQ